MLSKQNIKLFTLLLGTVLIIVVVLGNHSEMNTPNINKYSIVLLATSVPILLSFPILALVISDSQKISGVHASVNRHYYNFAPKRIRRISRR